MDCTQTQDFCLEVGTGDGEGVLMKDRVGLVDKEYKPDGLVTFVAETGVYRLSHCTVVQLSEA